jgi:hypothetical protein
MSLSCSQIAIEVDGLLYHLAVHDCISIIAVWEENVAQLPFEIGNFELRHNSKLCFLVYVYIY